MKVSINEGCIGCGLCEATYDKIFSIMDNGKAQVHRQLEEIDLSGVKDAIELCPAKAIKLSKW